MDGLVALSIANVHKHRPDLLKSERVTLIGMIKMIMIWLNKWQLLTILVGDGRQGFQDEAPYDAINVGAASATLPTAVKY